ncbi:MAG: ATP-binding protein [Verrucomicrobia bacterium]|nr:ATP-binding protein [Verrucomicrobiota bacterium]
MTTYEKCVTFAAETLEKARVNCSPKPLIGEGLDRFWVETADARDVHSSFRDNLAIVLQEEGTPRVLVHGHRGCGKSTEINKFLSQLGSEWLVVALRADDFLPPSGNEAADVLLAACTRLMDVVAEQKLSLNEDLLKPVLAFFAETTAVQTDERSSELQAEAGADVSTGVLGKLLGLKAKLVASLKFGSRTEQSTIHRVRRRKGELCAAVNALTIAAEKAWQAKKGNPAAKLLLVIEELDKLGLADARQIFVLDGRILSEVAVRAIYTIPVFTFHSADAGAIRSHFEHDLALPMIKVCQPDGKPCAEGRDTLNHLVRERVTPSVLPEDALSLLIERTGGVLRDIFEAIQTAAQFRTVRSEGIISRAAIDLALERMVTTLGLQIAYPPEDRKDPKILQEKLAEIARAQAGGQTKRAQPDPDLQLLLMSGALLEYNGTGWLGVHPLARKYLQDLGYDVGAISP